MRTSIPIFSSICCYFLFLHGCHSEHVLSRNARELPGGTEHDYSPGKTAAKPDNIIHTTSPSAIPSNTAKCPDLDSNDLANNRNGAIKSSRQRFNFEALHEKRRVVKRTANSCVVAQRSHHGLSTRRTDNNGRNTMRTSTSTTFSRENIRISDRKQNSRATSETRRSASENVQKLSPRKSIDSSRILQERTIQQTYSTRRNSLTRGVPVLSRTRRASAVDNIRRTQEIRKEISNTRQQTDNIRRNSLTRDRSVVPSTRRSRDADSSRKIREVRSEISDTRRHADDTRRNSLTRDRSVVPSTRRSRDADSSRKIREVRNEISDTRRHADDTRRNSLTVSSRRQRSRSVDARRIQDTGKENLDVRRKTDSTRRNSLTHESSRDSRIQRLRSVDTTRMRIQEIRKEVLNARQQTDNTRRNTLMRDSSVVSKTGRSRSVDATRRMREVKREVSKTRREMDTTRLNTLIRDTPDAFRNQRSRSLDSNRRTQDIRKAIPNTRRQANDAYRVSQTHDTLAVSRRSRSVESSRRIQDIRKDTSDAKRQGDNSRRNSIVRHSFVDSRTQRSRSVDSVRRTRELSKELSNTRRQADDTRRNSLTRESLVVSRTRRARSTDSSQTTQDIRNEISNTRRQTDNRRRNSLMRASSVDSRKRRSMDNEVSRRREISQEILNTRRQIDETTRNSLTRSTPLVSRTERSRSVDSNRRSRGIVNEISKTRRQIDNIRRNTLTRDNSDVSRSRRSRSLDSGTIQSIRTGISNTIRQIDTSRRHAVTRDTSVVSRAQRSRSVDSNRRIEETRRVIASTRRDVDNTRRNSLSRDTSFVHNVKRFRSAISETLDGSSNTRRVIDSTRRNLAVRDKKEYMSRSSDSERMRHSIRRNVHTRESRNDNENGRSIPVNSHRILSQARVTRNVREEMTNTRRHVDSGRRNVLLHESGDVSRNKRSRSVDFNRESGQERITFEARYLKSNTRRHVYDMDQHSVASGKSGSTESNRRQVGTEISNNRRLIDNTRRNSAIYESRSVYRRQTTRSADSNIKLHDTRRIRDVREETGNTMRQMRRTLRDNLSYDLPKAYRNQRSIHRTHQQIREKILDTRRQVDNIRQNARSAPQFQRSRLSNLNSFRTARTVSNREVKIFGNSKQFLVSSHQNFQFDISFFLSRNFGAIVVINLENKPSFVTQSSNNSLSNMLPLLTLPNQKTEWSTEISLDVPDVLQMTNNEYSRLTLPSSFVLSSDSTTQKYIGDNGVNDDSTLIMKKIVPSPLNNVKQSKLEKSTSEILSNAEADTNLFDIPSISTLKTQTPLKADEESSSNDQTFRKYFLDILVNITNSFKWRKEMPRTILISMLALLGMRSNKNINKPLNRQLTSIMPSIF